MGAATPDGCLSPVQTGSCPSSTDWPEALIGGDEDEPDGVGPSPGNEVGRDANVNGQAYRSPMTDRGHVRTLDGEEPPPAPRPRVAAPAAAAAGLLLGWLLGVAGTQGAEAPVAGVEEMREVALSGEQAEPARAVDVVRSFETAFNADDAVGAIATISHDWGRLEIPGTSRGVIPPGDLASMRETVAFATAAADLHLGVCSASPSRLDAVADFAVVCAEPEVTGIYAEAIGRAGGGQPMVFAIAGDRIISILWSGYAGDRYDTTAYCEFSQAQSENAARWAFDDECRPIESPSVVALHRNLAALYAAAGRPTPDVAVLEARYALPTIGRLFAAMEEAAPVGDYVDTRATLVGFPGTMLDPDVPGSPDTAELLAWIGAVYDVDLGPCTVEEWSGEGVGVQCPDAVWSGPLVTALGLGRVIQPIAFLVDDFVVTDLGGDTAPELATAFRRMCEWIKREAPAQAEWAFEEACLPDRTMTGVTALLDGAARYAAAHVLAPPFSPAES